jgi:hypothetical protein
MERKTGGTPGGGLGIVTLDNQVPSIATLLLASSLSFAITPLAIATNPTTQANLNTNVLISFFIAISFWVSK